MTDHYSELEQSTFPGAAQSGAVAVEPVALTPQALAAALLGLSPADRARLAAVLLRQDGKTETFEG